MRLQSFEHSVWETCGNISGAPRMPDHRSHWHAIQARSLLTNALHDRNNRRVSCHTLGAQESSIQQSFGGMLNNVVEEVFSLTKHYEDLLPTRSYWRQSWGNKSLTLRLRLLDYCSVCPALRWSTKEKGSLYEDAQNHTDMDRRTSSGGTE